MSQPLPSTDLDEVLRQTRHLMLDFDGPVCTLFPHQGAATVAEHLRALIAAQPIQLPESITKTADPLAVLFFATTLSADLAARVESELSAEDLTAAATATPAGHIHDLISSCRESGRSVTVVSQISARAVNSYLERNSLDSAVGLVLARDRPSPLASKADLIESALTRLDTVPTACALVTASPTTLEAARLAGTHTIGYTHASGNYEALAAAGADALVPSLADLVLRLRARPLPN